MVCVPCIVIPFVLWFFHKFIRPIVMKVWPWSKQEKIDDGKSKQNGASSDGTKTDVSEANGNSNGVISNGHTVTAGGEDKKNK